MNSFKGQVPTDTLDMGGRTQESRSPSNPLMKGNSNFEVASREAESEALGIE